MTQAEMDYQRIEKAIRFLDDHAGRQPSLEQMAAHVHLSEFHFNRLFKRWAGTTPRQFLAALTRDHAKQLLREGASVLDTSLGVGLSGPGRLHDLFIRCEAMTPGEYKNGGEGLQMSYGFYRGPCGPCFMARTVKGLFCIRFYEAGEEAAMLETSRAELPKALWTEQPGEVRKLGDQIFGAEGKGTVQLHVKGSSFQFKVWEALLRIPEGRLVSYGQLAEAIGKPGASRAVGNAVGANPVALLIPCHRVLRESGALGGYRWGTVRKRILLGRELALRSD